MFSRGPLGVRIDGTAIMGQLIRESGKSNGLEASLLGEERPSMSIRPIRSYNPVLSLALALSACAGSESTGTDGAGSEGTGDADGASDGGGDGGDGDDGGSGGDGDSGGTDGDDGGSDGGDDSGGDGDDDSDGEPPQQVLARDIELTDMTINQGVRVILRQGGELTDPAGRSANLVPGRPALVRLGWSIPPDWEPRILEGRMYVDPDGAGPEEPTFLQAVASVEGPSDPADPSSTFNWPIPGELITPQTSLRIEAWEGQPGQEDRPESEPAPILELGTQSGLGIPAAENSLRITVVRFDYKGNTPDVDDEAMAALYDRLFEYNALTDIDLDLHPEVIQIDQTIESFSSVLSPLQDLHDAEAGPNHFYYGLIDVGDGELGGAGGMAWSNVSAGLWYMRGGSFTYHTFVHEIGHNLGRPHTPGCDAGGPDNSYPDPLGRTMTWGYAVLQNQLKSPTGNYDYMSYCSPPWVSEWTWVRTANAIESISRSPGPVPPVYIGYLDEAGRRRWQRGTATTLMASADDRSDLPATWVDAQGDDGRIERLRALELPTDDGGSVLIAPMVGDLRPLH